MKQNLECALSENLVSDKFYVSPNGNDSNPGTYEEPLQTIAAARSLVRDRNNDMDKDIEVYLREGTYIQTETLEFTEEDSGTNGHMVTYKAYGDEKVVISGGRKLENDWTLKDEAKGIYKMTVTDVPEEFDTRQLYVNGKRAIRAKGSLPDAVFGGENGIYTSYMEFQNWKNLKNVEFVFDGVWTLPRVLVESVRVDPDTANRLQIKMNPYMWPLAINKGYTSVKSEPWWIENAYELLDEPGEWYLDKTGEIGDAPNTFYYIPRDGEDMKNVDVIVPMIEELMTIKGADIEKPVTNLQFEGISFQHAGWLRPNKMGGVSDGQDNNIREGSIGGDKSTGGNIYLNCTRKIIFNCCEFVRMGNAAVYLNQGNKDCLINGCHFYDISAQAVKIGDVDCNDPLNFYLPRCPKEDYEPGDPRWYTTDDWDWRYLQSNNDVTNNVIHNIGVEYKSASAIGVAVVEESDISHNEIYDIPYAGIHIGLGWGVWKDLKSPMGNNKIQFNYIHDNMKFLIDAGAVYANGSQYGTSGKEGWARKTIISDNYLKDQKNLFGSIYLDDGANYYEVTRNVVQDSPMFLSNKHPQNNIYGNYSNQTYYTNDGAKWEAQDPNAVHDNVFVTGDDFPEEAREIMKNAGLEKGYSHKRFECC